LYKEDIKEIIKVFLTNLYSYRTFNLFTFISYEITSWLSNKTMLICLPMYIHEWTQYTSSTMQFT